MEGVEMPVRFCMCDDEVVGLEDETSLAGVAMYLDKHGLIK